jgi:hypothetical protein
MKKLLLLLLPGLLAMLLLPGCASTLDKTDRMNQSLFAYAKAVRWSRFDMVYAFHRGPDGAPPALTENLKGIQVTGYEVMNSNVGPEAESVSQTVAIRYLDRDTGRERMIEDRQEWEHDAERDRWYVISPPPRFE